MPISTQATNMFGSNQIRSIKQTCDVSSELLMCLSPLEHTHTHTHLQWSQNTLWCELAARWLHSCCNGNARAVTNRITAAMSWERASGGKGSLHCSASRKVNWVNLILRREKTKLKKEKDEVPHAKMFGRLFSFLLYNLYYYVISRRQSNVIIGHASDE